MNVFDFIKKKQVQEKLTLVTCYDYTMAKLLSDTMIDGLLVGDSVAMTMHGYNDTLQATLEMMCWHTAAVRRGIGCSKFIISDMPFLSYRQSLSKNVLAAQTLMQAGANALKLENAQGNLKLIHHLTESGIPIMGHLGLTMQLMHTLGGLKVQGKNLDTAKRMEEDALALQQAGCFAIVLECIPSKLANAITQSLSIPTIGIGAGSGTDGQILVVQDLLGMNQDFKPKFVKQFVDGASFIRNGIGDYIEQVKALEFPNHETSYDN
jgi:3-methyl-2-oxobutanoate hydroxymethyltransferase